MNLRLIPFSVLLLLLATSVIRAEPPKVNVARPLVREIVDYASFTGRADASQSVSVRSRATGYLTKILFKEGSIVNQGDVLFEIDPRPYQATLDQAKAQVA